MIGRMLLLPLLASDPVINSPSSLCYLQLLFTHFGATFVLFCVDFGSWCSCSTRALKGTGSSPARKSTKVLLFSRSAFCLVRDLGD
jgi:hypothetical protein